MATAFETKTCSRCLGSGHYSFCQMHGSTCFGCAGSGRQYTARGKAALAFYHQSMLKPASEIKVGDLVSFGNGFKRVLKIGQSQSYSVRTVGSVVEVRTYYTDIETAKVIQGVFANTPVRTVRDEAHRQELLAAAVAYQNGLTKTGKVPKRAKKAA